MPREFSDDVDPKSREPLSVDGAAPLRFPNRPLYDNQIRTFDDSGLGEPKMRFEDTFSAETVVLEVLDSKPAKPQIQILLSPREQRKIVEAEKGEPCFRMWMSPDEWDRVKPIADWTVYMLSDGRMACWRRQGDLNEILKTNIRLWSEICNRILDDDVI